MIEVREQPEIQLDPRSGWQLIFWVLDAFNYATPFRRMLAEIAHALGQDPETDLRLPAFETGEDFVEGSLSFGNAFLGIYYEHSLSYLSLTHEEEAILREVADRVRSRVRIIRS